MRQINPLRCICWALVAVTIFDLAAMKAVDADGRHKDLWSASNQGKTSVLNPTSLTPTKTELDKRAGEVPGPEWFYSRGPWKRCHRKEFVYNLAPQKFESHGIDVDDFPDWKGGFADREAAYRAIGFAQDRCRKCQCDKDGRLIPKNHVRGARVRACRSVHAANMCMVIFGCYCYVELGQPQPTATGLSISDYQKALDSIPDVFKFQHKYYKWVHGLGDNPGDSITFSDTRTRVAGTAEPYYVEGPSIGNTWDWLRNMRGGFSGSGMVFKREMIRSGEETQNRADDKAGAAWFEH
ncbi:hypothetical protein TWF696_004637 [Orbilia brochopaga]|uniref:Uncharacterized protein n=1 Tax=Orbilia brochopaga TaxID=3140254 RepID=A0AAV9V8K0_9PEZI